MSMLSRVMAEGFAAFGLQVAGLSDEGAPRTGRVAGAVFVLAMAAGAAVVASGSLRAETEPSVAEDESAAWGGQRALALPVSGITVDGRLDDWPAEIPVHPIRSNTDAYGETDISGADLDASSDFSPSFRAGYSIEQQRLYVAVEVRDDSVHARETGHQDTDALEIYLAARPGAEPVYYVLCPPGGAYGTGRPNPSVLVPGLDELPLDRSGSRGAVGREGDVTVYEWSLELLGDSLMDAVELRPGMTLGFDVAAVDQDSETGTAAWVSWTPPTRKFSGGGRIGGLVLGRAGGDLGQVAVRVEDEAGEALAGAWFELWREGLKVTAALTDAGGRSSAAVPEGTYDIRVAAHGFHTQVLERRIAGAAPVSLDLVLEDLGTRFHVDDDAPPGGDGGEARPFATIAAALAVCSPGDTVHLAPGTYDQPLELIPHVTILGAGRDRTRVAGEAHWGLGLRPFITYYGGRGEDMWAVHRPGVTMAGFTLDGGGEYPDRTAEEVSDLLAVVTAIGHRTLGTYATAEDAAAVRDLLEARPGLASARIQAPGAWPGGSTLLHRVVSIYDDASDAEHEIARLLIEHGADVNALGGQARGRGETALGYAGFFGDSRLVELYLAHGGDPNRPGASGLTPLDVTAHEGSHEQGSTTHIPALEALIEAGGRHDPGHLVLLRHISRLEADLDADPDSRQRRHPPAARPGRAGHAAPRGRRRLRRRNRPVAAGPGRRRGRPRHHGTDAPAEGRAPGLRPGAARGGPGVPGAALRAGLGGPDRRRGPGRRRSGDGDPRGRPGGRRRRRPRRLDAAGCRRGQGARGDRGAPARRRRPLRPERGSHAPRGPPPGTASAG